MFIFPKRDFVLGDTTKNQKTLKEQNKQSVEKIKIALNPDAAKVCVRVQFFSLPPPRIRILILIPHAHKNKEEEEAEKQKTKNNPKRNFVLGDTTKNQKTFKEENKQ